MSFFETYGRSRRAGAALAVAAVVLASAALAGGATGAPKFADCISGDAAATKPNLNLGGDGNCSAIPSASTNGDSGMAADIALATSADGTSVYTVSYSNDSISQFKRSKQTGKLSYQGCISGSDELGPNGSGACKLIPSHTADAALSGLDQPRGVVVSRDGKSVYVAAGAQDDDSIATFERSKQTGKLTYAGCISGNTALGPSGGGGSGACDLLPDATSGGSLSGLHGPRDLVVSRDGKALYGVTRGDEDLFRFKRAGDGELTWKGCITGASTVAAAHACKPLPVAAATASNTALDSPEYALLSADEKNVYVSSRGDDAISTFKRERQSGALTFKRCLSGSVLAGPAGGGGSGACKLIDSATANGDSSGLNSPYQMGVSGDGKSLYAAVSNDSAVTTFKRSKHGKISFDRCITGSAPVAASEGGGPCKAAPEVTADGGGSGFAGEVGLAVRGTIVVALAQGDEAVGAFKRSKKTGRLTFQGCLSDDPILGPSGTTACSLTPRPGVDAGLRGATQLAFGGSDLYVSAAGNAAVTRVKP